MAGFRQPWSTAWKQVRVGAWRVTERGRRLKQENKWIFKRVKNGWLGKCPHAVRKWPSRAGLAPIRRDERPGVTDHHPPLLGCFCHSRQKLASNSASVARIPWVIQQLGLHWVSLALCETTAAYVAYTVSLSSQMTHRETIMNNKRRKILTWSSTEFNMKEKAKCLPFSHQNTYTLSLGGIGYAHYSHATLHPM